MKVLLLNYVALKSKELFTKKFNKFGTKFSEGEKETNSLVNNLETFNQKLETVLIRNSNRNQKKIEKKDPKN